MSAWETQPRSFGVSGKTAPGVQRYAADSPVTKAITTSATSSRLTATWRGKRPTVPLSQAPSSPPQYESQKDPNAEIEHRGRE